MKPHLSRCYPESSNNLTIHRTSRGNRRLSRMLVIALTAALLSACAGTQFHHDYIMRGQVVSVKENDTLICIGNAKGISAGQRLKAYRIISGSPIYDQDEYSDFDFDIEYVGEIEVVTIINEHFAKATIKSGSVTKHDMIELQ